MNAVVKRLRPKPREEDQVKAGLSGIHLDLSLNLNLIPERPAGRKDRPLSYILMNNPG
jgi:hypothetical protein